jgi:hypothetical protein
MLGAKLQLAEECHGSTVVPDRVMARDFGSEEHETRYPADVALPGAIIWSSRAIGRCRLKPRLWHRFVGACARCHHGESDQESKRKKLVT